MMSIWTGHGLDQQLQRCLILLLFCANSSLCLTPTLLPPTPLCLCACGCGTSKSSYCLPLRAAYICLLPVETKETDHKAYYGARSGVHTVHMGLWGLDTNTHTHFCKDTCWRNSSAASVTAKCLNPQTPKCPHSNWSSQRWKCTRSHTQTLLCHSPPPPHPPPPHVMPVTWFPGKQLSKSESDFYF